MELTAAAPLYTRTAEMLRARITSGVWTVGNRLPAEHELCREFGVSSITMRRAIAMLAAEGLVVRLQGKGTFVSSSQAIVHGPPQMTSFTQDMELRGWHPSARLVRSDIVPADEKFSVRMGLPENSKVFVLTRIRLADGQPIALQTAYIPARLVPNLDSFDLSTGSLYELLEKEYGLRPARASESWEAGIVSDIEAELLEVTAGSPAFRVERLTSDSSGHRIELVQSVIRGDRYRLVLQLGPRR
jgi:GntR family transcriptional regulator